MLHDYIYNWHLYSYWYYHYYCYWLLLLSHLYQLYTGIYTVVIMTWEVLIIYFAPIIKGWYIVCFCLHQVILLPTYRQDIAWDIAWTNCCRLTLVACMAFKFLISYFCCSISFAWACILWSFWLPLFWEQVFCSADFQDELILFMAGLTLDVFIPDLNIEMHSAQNWVKFILLSCVFKTLHAIAAKYGSLNWEANLVLSASFTLFFPWGPYTYNLLA